MADDKLLEIVTRASEGEYYIPEIQRVQGFVWKPEQVRKLCDSLYRGYPISVLLLWSNKDYAQPYKGSPNNVRQPLWIIDGQQRITSLCLLFGQKPYWYGPEEWTDLQKKHKVLLNINETDGKTQFSGRHPKEGWKAVPVPKILSKKNEEEIADLSKEVAGDDDVLVHRLLKPLLHLWNIRTTLIPVIRIDGKEPEEIAEIFDRINRGGTRIKETDTRFAIIAGYNLGWKRDEFDPFLNELEERGWDIPPGYLLQAMTIFHLGKARMNEVKEDFWKEDVKDVWRKFKDVLDEITTYLWDKGIPGIDLVPSEYTLIPLLAMHAKFRKTQGYSFDAAFQWFLRANMESRYSDAPLQKLTEDAAAINNSETLDQALSKMQHEEDISEERLKSCFEEPFSKGGFASLLIHLLLWQRNASDWLQNLSLKAAQTNHGILRPHWHHIMPRGWAKRNGFAGADSASNVTILTETTNVRKLGARPPWDYVHRNNISQQALEEHFIPEDTAHQLVKGDAMDKTEFAAFLDRRASLLACATLEYLGGSSKK